MLPGSLSILAKSKYVAKLTVGKAVNAASSSDGEVTPDIGAASEIKFVHHTARWLETLARIFGCNTAGSGMTPGLRSPLSLHAILLREIKVDFARGLRVHPVQQANVTDAVKRQTHSYLQLCRRQLDTADHFRGRMLH